MGMPGLPELIIIGVLLIMPLIIGGVVLLIVLSRRSDRPFYEPPHDCPGCQGPLSPADQVCPQCGHSLERP